MRRTALHRAVAQATGESLATIQRLGFLLADPNLELHSAAEEQDPYVIDWDALEARRHAELVGDFPQAFAPS